MEVILSFLVFFLQVCLGAALGIAKPAAFSWFKSDLFTYSLGFLMLSMGLTLTVDDFRQVIPGPHILTISPLNV
jgi:bile acid:Na+ symporter, BASS family